MNRYSRFMAAGSGLAIGAVALLAAQCSKSGNNPDAGAASCTTQSLQVVFSPMYSAFDGTHKFQVPAIVTGIDPTIIKWASSNESVATVESDSTVGGAMITMTGAGSAEIVATAGGLCGSSTLTVDSATASDWQTGSDRYNNGVGLRNDAGTRNMDPTCTSCHGPTANGAFMDIAHTPEQTGGFSDDVIQNIVTNGSVPDGGYFDPSILPYKAWQHFHHWQLDPTEVKGLTVYLRSLTPTPQNGTANFGGHGPGNPPDGGYPDGGFHHRPHDMAAHD